MEIEITINDILSNWCLSMKDLSDEFNIPYRTVQNWVGGVSKPPKYVLIMIWNILDYKYQFSVVRQDRNMEQAENERLNKLLDRASDLLHDSRIKEAISLIDNA